MRRIEKKELRERKRRKKKKKERERRLQNDGKRLRIDHEGNSPSSAESLDLPPTLNPQAPPPRMPSIVCCFAF